jgi:hypothetical protein
MSQRQSRILAALRHGALDFDHLVHELDEPSYAVRGELSAMRRAWLIRERYHFPGGYLWELTDRGMELAWSAHQLKLDAR